MSVTVQTTVDTTIITTPLVDSWEELIPIAEAAKKNEKKRVRAEARKARDAKTWAKVSKEQKVRIRKEKPEPVHPAKKQKSKEQKFTQEKEPKDNLTLILKNLPFDNTWTHEIMDIFEHHGELRFVNVLRNEDRTCKGVAFVRFMEPENATKAIGALPDFWYNGRKVFVEYAKPRK